MTILLIVRSKDLDMKDFKLFALILALVSPSLAIKCQVCSGSDGKCADINDLGTSQTCSGEDNACLVGTDNRKYLYEISIENFSRIYKYFLTI